MMKDHQEITHPGIKVTTAWLTAILTSGWQTFSTIPWDKLAQFAAFLYTIVLIIEWIRKRIKAYKGEKPTGFGDL